jgi:hypothetical protein
LRKAQDRVADKADRVVARVAWARA